MAIAAVCVADANYFIPSTTLDLGIGTALLATDCPPTIPATPPSGVDPWITPNGPWIAFQCPEACGGTEGGTFVRWEQDANNLDWIYVRCANGTMNRFNEYGQLSNGHPLAYEIAIPASSSCWNCIDGCAGDTCPPGQTCLPKAKEINSDCRRWVCNDPNYGQLVENRQTGIPDCKRTTLCPPSQQCTPATILLDGPTAIKPGASCTWTAEAFSECTGANYEYYWYVSNQFAGTGQYYSGGRPSGVQIGYSWPIRVEVTYNGYAAGSKEIYVKESNKAGFCIN
jgi:hypothetical protein